jgi:hypothetical protein
MAMVIACAGFLFLLVLQHQARPHAKLGMYFHSCTSENFMQTVSIEDLRDAPFQSLWNLHIQPPALDALRALLASAWRAPDPASLLRKVDGSLYLLGAVLYGLAGALIFVWLARLTRPAYAAVAAVLFLAHPATIFYATLLDTTLLSAVLVTWAYYLLWKLRADSASRIGGLAVALLLLFFTRSIFQLPALVVFTVSLVLLGVSRRAVAIFALSCACVMGLYTAKQVALFNLMSTSSFVGLNLVNSIGDNRIADYFRAVETFEPEPEANPPLPGVLARRVKFDGTPNFNNIGYLKVNSELTGEFKESLKAMSLPALIRSYLRNLRIYFKPSSDYAPHVIVDHLPWRALYDRVFSFPILNGLLALAGMFWFLRVGRQDYRAAAGLLLPGLFIFASSVLFEKGENMRFKFFLEPVLFLFMAFEFRAAALRLFAKRDVRVPVPAPAGEGSAGLDAPGS